MLHGKIEAPQLARSKNRGVRRNAPRKYLRNARLSINKTLLCRIGSAFEFISKEDFLARDIPARP
jgi:hypothetical protein